MTKFNRTRFKKAMAAILAVAMVGQNCSYVVSAEDVLNTDAVVQEQTVQETEQQTADIQPVEEAPQTENVEVPQTDSAASVTEVPAETPVEAQSTAVDNQSADTQVEKPEESTEAINNESSDADTETTQGEADSDADTENAQDNAQSQEEAPTATWHVTFAGDAAAHGTIQVKGEAAPADVASYNKEVKENEKFEFSITAAQGFEVERVTLEANGAELGKNAESFYEIPAVTKDEKVLVTYRELPQEPVAEPEPPAAEEPVVEEPSEGVRENEVDFITDGGAAVIVDGVDVTNGSAMAKDGTIVYTIIPNNDYEIVSILIDNDPNLPARFNEATEEVNDYITEGISETTSVVITTKAIEPVEEEPAEEPNEEISPEKPAQKLTATAADGARITVNAPEGALPEGSAVVVEVIESKAIESALENALEPAGKELNSYKAYDITIIGPDGTAIQPDDSVKVSIRNATVDGEENAVYHVDGASVDKIADIANGNNASFEAEHFSIYVITGENTPAIATYEFYDKDGTSKINSQRVKDGEVLVEPAAPEYEGQYFTGWFVEGSAIPLSFGPVSVSSSGTIKVVAGYEDAYYVFFKNDAGVVINTKTGRTGDIISTDDVTFPVLANEGITGWYTDSALTSKVTNVELNNSDVILYPKVEKGYHITYKSEGGSYTAPVFVPPATSTVAPTAPTRPGYNFKYWSVAQNGLKYQFGKELTADLTLHAVWEAMDTTYLVMYWQENANYNNGYLEEESKRDKEQYSYVASETKTGKTGAQTNVNSWKGLIIPEGFTLKNIEQQTIAGDGSTVVNVYLDRKTFTVKFMKDEGYYYSRWVEDESLRITAKYGADVSSKWPGGTWGVSEYSSTRQANLFVMPNGGATFYEYSAGDTNTAYYYVQTLPNESGVITVGNTNYKLHHSDTAYGRNLSVTKEDRYGLIGFTNQPDISAKDRARYNGAKFYYTRNKYPIAFISGGTTIKTLEKYYEESLTDVSCGETLTPPAGKESYEFAGWYDNPEGEGTEYSFEGKRMPANGITVYAKWVAPTYNIEIYHTVDASDTPIVIRKSLGEKLSEGDLQVTVPEGYIFRGWYLYENEQRTQAYNSDTEIHGDIKLVPYWTSNKAFSVTYSAGEGGTGTVSDPLSYAEGAQAELKSAAGLTPPTGKPYFQGWKSETDNRIYYPGDKYLIKTENVKFVAQWGEEKKTTLAYDPGTGNGVVTSVTVENNAEVNAKSVEELGFSKENFTFVGWSYTNAERKPAVAKAGDKLYVDVNTNPGNTITAQWAKLSADGGEWPYDGSSHTVSNVKVDGDVAGYTIAYVVDGSEYVSADAIAITNAGTKTVTVIARKAGYIELRKDVTLTVTPKAVTVKAEDKSKVYGEKDPELTATVSGTIGDDKVAYSLSRAEGEAVGNYAITASGEEKQGNYTVTYIQGILTITGQSIVPEDPSYKGVDVDSPSDHEYDGNEHKWEPTVKDGSGTELTAGTDYEVSYDTEDFVNVKTITVTIKGIGNYKGQVTRTYKITPKAVTVTADDKSKVYGETDPALTAAVSGTIGNDTVDYSLSRDAGEAVGDYAITASGEAEQGNYTVTYNPGTLTITKKGTLTVTGTSYNHEYDANVHGTAASVNVTEGTKVSYKVGEDGEWTEEVPTIKDVGSKEVTVKAENPNYETAEDRYTLTVTPKAVTVTAEDKSKVYGEEDPELTATVSGTIGDDTVDYSLSREEGEAVGNYAITASGEEKQGNYTVTYNPGTLTIIAKNIGDDKNAEVDSPVDVTYNGLEQKWEPTVKDKKTGEVLVKDRDYTVSYEGDVVNVTKPGIQVTITGIENYSGSVERSYKILPKEVIVITENGNKVYDTKPLTAPGTMTGLVNDETAGFVITGSQTLVGASANTYEITWKSEEEAVALSLDDELIPYTAKESNYVVNETIGTLTVTDGTEEEPIDPNLVVKKNDAQDDGYEYKLGETVSFTISATNIYAEAKDVTITELDGVIIEGSDAGAPNVLIKKDVAPGETVTATATYIITERDIAEGFFRNTVKVSFDGEKQYENEKTVEVEDAERKYTLTKTFGPSTHENGMFKAGETIHYTITVKNTGNQTLNQVEITDTLNAAGTISNIQGAAYKQDGKVTVFTIPTLEALGADVVITYDYVVQDADKGNKISNAAVGSGADPDKPDEKKPQDDTEVTVENPQLQVQKNVVSIVAADGTVKDPAGKADQNDIITYSVTVKNTGNVKLLGTKITDSLEGIQLAEGQSFEIGDLEVGAEKTVTYTYVVKATDLGKTILNIATATANVPENPEDAPKPENKDEKKVETEDPANCSIIVTKKLTNINGELLALKSAQFNVALFTDEAMTQRIGDVKTIAFGENQGTATVTFENLKRGIYYVAETDAEGKVVENGQYNDGSYIAVYQAGNKVEITENGTAAAFEFSNQFVILPGEYYIVKKINITKNVFTKDGEELDSDETFYAGIFKDAEYTQLADNVSQNIVPLALNGKASVSQTVEVTVPVGGEEVTLYIAEVNKDGVPVDQVEDFAYTSEVENAVVTLSETSEDAETVIDNTSTKDEPTITPEPTEPLKKPETPQEPDTTGTQKKGVKTGDDTPIGQFGFLLMCSVACVTLIIGKRKKEKRS